MKSAFWTLIVTVLPNLAESVLSCDRVELKYRRSI